jgi:hypothetical protein
MDNVKDILNIGKRAKGRSERIGYLEGKRLTRQQAILAHCYDCTGGYDGGPRDCGIDTCSLYRYHAYRRVK